MMTLIRVLFEVFRVTAADFLARVNAVYDGLNLNPSYPNTPVPLPVFRLAIDDYAASLAAALDGGARAVARRDDLGVRLQRMLRLLGAYVEVTSNGDMATFMSSGFQPASVVRTRANPVSESIRKIEPGPTSGQLGVTLVALRGAGSYELRWAPVLSGGTPGTWTTHNVVGTRPPIAVAGLTPGTTYAFQARALTKSGFTDWGDPVTRICM